MEGSKRQRKVSDIKKNEKGVFGYVSKQEREKRIKKKEKGKILKNIKYQL